MDKTKISVTIQPKVKIAIKKIKAIKINLGGAFLVKKVAPQAPLPKTPAFRGPLRFDIHVNMPIRGFVLNSYKIKYKTLKNTFCD